MRKIILGLLTLLIFSCNRLKIDLPKKISINSNWQFKGIDTLDWKTATVPGNIFTDLLSHQIIEDPFIKTNEEKVQWVSKKDWEYKTTFTLTDEILSKKNIELHFDGLDTYAKIFVNGSLQLTTDNAFRSYSIPVKKLLKKENELRIIFKNSEEVGKNKANKNPYQLPEGNRIYTRKAQFQTGWDWGPKLNTSGIWKDVSLKAHNQVIIENLFIQKTKITDRVAKLNCTLNLKYNYVHGYSFEIFINNELVKIYKDHPHYSPLSIPFEIKKPKLWWTHNLGEPYLYNIKIIVKKENAILDSISTKYGIRDVKLINKKDSIGESFGFELNGKPIYIKGANYIPQNSFQNKVSNQHYEKLLSDVVVTNMNMLRVWGGGIYENDIFYDLCDEKGILVWQDFMFACAMYPGDKNFLENIKVEAEQQVKRLRNHASIALWCGNNENAEGWKRWGWQFSRTEKEKQEIWNDYLAVFDSILPKTVADFSETDYWETSPKYGRGNPKYKTEGDAHDWWIWHDSYPFEHLENNVPRFMSEFGFQSYPSFEVINYINQKDSIDLKTDAIKAHQKHARGFQLIDEYIGRDYKIPTHDEDYVYVSQLLQAKGIIMGIEAQRRAKPYNMGTLYWQLNDCWPAISWSSIDYFGNWKALQYKAKKAFENILISSKIKNNIVQTFIVNDTFEKLNGTLQFKIINFYGEELWSDSKEIEVLENSSQQFHEFSLAKVDRKNSVLITTFNNKKSIFYFDKPKELNLPKGELKQEITKTKNGFSITLKSDTLQKDVFLYTSTKGHFYDNFFDVLPNETKVVEFKTTAKKIDTLKIKTLLVK
ncbi:beta-mannosidase [Polaribacter sp.]|uniref:beta-mannosidase n=1 Tax=Polaribacter sp. TaxID=1920175 RepID=UPI003F6BDEE3